MGITICALAIIIPKTSIGLALDLAKTVKGGRHLVLLANNTELRPSGGFIGSFAIIDTRPLVPKIEYIETNIYKADNQFAQNNFIDLPAPLQKVLGKDKSWALHDSNWSTDFPESAQTSLWFYQQEYNDTLDGVILINATSVRDLLALTGPITNTDTKIVLNYNNFFAVLSNAIENDYWLDPRNEEINEPKSILKNLFPALKGKIASLRKWDILRFTVRALKRKDIALYNTNPQKEKIILYHNWGGHINPAGNFLYVTNAAVGTKTSLATHESIEYRLQSSNKLAQIKITRKHTGKNGAYDGGSNINYTIVHLPASTQLREILVGGEKNNTVDKSSGVRYDSYGFWNTTAPGSTTVIDITADLPADLALRPLTVFKQLGSANENISIYLDNVLLIRHNLDTDFTIQ